MYLAGLGRRPLDPDPGEERRIQQEFWFPENFDLFKKCRVLPREEVVDGAACVVVEGEIERKWAEGRVRSTEKIWFDPKLGFTPRKWESRADGVLWYSRTNAEFEEFAPGCWLPWRSASTFGTPSWVAPELRDRPAYSYTMRLRRARVNDVGDDLRRSFDRMAAEVRHQLHNDLLAGQT